MASSPSPDTLRNDPVWLAHRFDDAAQAVRFVHVDRAARRRAVFLTDEYLPASLPRADAPLAAVTPPPDRAPLHFIFHSAFCCSSLLANAFDLPGISAPLKEPVILNDVTGWHRRGGDPQRIATVLPALVSLLARPLAAGEATIIKPSNVVAAWMPALLAARPHARALLLHAPLPVYLGSIARKGMWGRLWVRDLLVKLLRDRVVDVGLSSADDYLALTDLQAAAVGWLAQHRLFARLAERFGERVRIVDSETLLARKVEAVAATAALFGLRVDNEAAQAIAAGPAFGRHAKTGASFGSDARAAERSAEQPHAEEIAKVTAWAQAVADGAGIDLAPGPPLLP